MQIKTKVNSSPQVIVTLYHISREGQVDLSTFPITPIYKQVEEKPTTHTEEKELYVYRHSVY